MVTDAIEPPGAAVILADRSRMFRRSCMTWLALAGRTVDVHEIEHPRALPAALEAMPGAWCLLDPTVLRLVPAVIQTRLRQRHAGLVWRSPEPPGRGSPASARLAFHLPRPRDGQRFLDQWRYVASLAAADLVEAGTVGEILGLAPARAAAYLAAFAEETAHCLTELDAGLAEQSTMRVNAARHALCGCAAAMGARALAQRIEVTNATALAAVKLTRERTLATLALAARAYGVTDPA